MSPEKDHLIGKFHLPTRGCVSFQGCKGWKLGRETTREDLATNWADMLCQNVRGQDEKTAQTLQGALNIEKQLLAVRAKHSHLQDILDSTVCHFIVDCRGQGS